jgi:protein-S-isoprenylcysteine O-methyltransferase Ste14
VRRTTRAAAGSLVFLVVAPGTMAGLLPWLISGWQVGDDAPKLVGLRLAGVLVLALGVAGVLDTFVRFVREGRGTPAPVAPTELLVTGGPYRYVRNPMYLAVTLVILGQALLLVRASLVVYAGAFFAVVASFVHWYEEPTLLEQFGESYDRYRRTVPAWIPRPWRHR